MSTCESCSNSGNSLNIAKFVVLLSIFTLAFIIFVRPPKCIQRIHKVASNFFHCFHHGSLKVTWNTYQIISAIPVTSSVDYPEPFATWLSGLSFMSFDFLGSDCLFQQQSYFWRVYVMASLPPIVAAIITLVCAAWAATYPHHRRIIQNRWLPYSLLLLSCKFQHCFR